jgi:hypothetical protein
LPARRRGREALKLAMPRRIDQPIDPLYRPWRARNQMHIRAGCRIFDHPIGISIKRALGNNSNK